MAKLKASPKAKVPMSKSREVKSSMNSNRMGFNRDRNEKKKTNEYMKNVRS